MLCRCGDLADLRRPRGPPCLQSGRFVVVVGGNALPVTRRIVGRVGRGFDPRPSVVDRVCFALWNEIAGRAPQGFEVLLLLVGYVSGGRTAAASTSLKCGAGSRPYAVMRLG